MLLVFFVQIGKHNNVIKVDNYELVEVGLQDSIY